MERTFGRLAAIFLIHFETNEFYPQIRRQHFTEIDIFAFVGGLLGLFFGFSVLSFAEIVYFFGVRVIWRNQQNVSTDLRNQEESKNSFLLPVKLYVLSYMKSSSIHSFAFIGDAERNLIERGVWLATFVFSMTGCTLMILKLYQKLDINVISLSIDDGVYDASNIPFPAITFNGKYPNYRDNLVLDYKMFDGSEETFEKTFDYDSIFTPDFLLK